MLLGNCSQSTVFLAVNQKEYLLVNRTTFKISLKRLYHTGQCTIHVESKILTNKKINSETPKNYRILEYDGNYYFIQSWNLMVDPHKITTRKSIAALYTFSSHDLVVGCYY